MKQDNRGVTGYCEGCGAGLTEVDEETNRCTQCGEPSNYYRCPWCDRMQTPSEIRQCSGFKVHYTEAELRDVYSDPTDRSKLERMLKEINQ